MFTSVDKASNNLSFICKSYYLKNIEDELNNTSTYELSDKTEENIVKEHIRFCHKFNIKVNDRILPFLHMIPKFHKHTLDFRYIAAGKRSSSKELSKILSAAFKIIDNTLKYSDNFEFKFKNTSGYWIVKNKDTTLSILNYLNNSSTADAYSINSFDFKKLYTNLPHDKVIAKISELIVKAFSEKKVEYINISKKFRASWSNKGRGHWALKKDDIVEMFTFLINNIYVKFGNTVYIQTIGIPM